jgi:uncharacterized membrane protein
MKYLLITILIAVILNIGMSFVLNEKIKDVNESINDLKVNNARINLIESDSSVKIITKDTVYIFEFYPSKL